LAIGAPFFIAENFQIAFAFGVAITAAKRAMVLMEKAT
jgi:hypothetical protein